MGGGAAIAGTNIYRVADGKIVEMWWSKDILPYLLALGALPPPPVVTAAESQSWGQVKELHQ